jgi:hypothetical protein
VKRPLSVSVSRKSSFIVVNSTFLIRIESVLTKVLSFLFAGYLSGMMMHFSTKCFKVEELIN